MGNLGNLRANLGKFHTVAVVSTHHAAACTTMLSSSFGVPEGVISIKKLHRRLILHCRVFLLVCWYYRFIVSMIGCA